MSEMRRTWAWILLSLPFLAQCGDIQLGTEQKDAGGGRDGLQASGGASTLQGGRTGQAGGTAGSADGGVPGSRGGSAATAGAVSDTGGAATGGAATGGAATGGVATGGVTTGGVASGGIPFGTGGCCQSGGRSGSGGSPTGGVATGGVATGGGCSSSSGAGGLPHAVQLGDVDGDGHIDADDATAIHDYVFAAGQLCRPEAADVDCNAQIARADEICVSGLAQGLIAAFRCDFSVGLGAPGAGGSAGQLCGLKNGDVNGDGVLDAADANQVSQFYVCNPVTTFYWVVADANCDGRIDIVDGLLIAQYAQVGVPTAVCNAGSGGAGGAGGAPGVAGSAGVPNTAGSAGRSGACTPGTTGKLGDANGDGVVDLLDADAVALHSSGGVCDVSGFLPELADVNCDCRVDLWDARLIAKYVQHAIDQLGCAAQ
jgi:hypothetical protein